MSDEKTKGPKAGFTRPVHLIFQVMDDNGKPIDFNKDRLKILAATRDAGIALDAIDSGKNEFVTHKTIQQVT